MAITPSEAAKDIVKRLHGTWHGAYGKARCPAHDDRSPSLSVTIGDKAVLFHCFAGCDNEAVLAALRRFGDLPRPTAHEAMPLRSDQLDLCRELWRDALPLTGSPAQLYLDLRGIGHSVIGRYAPAAVTYEKGRKLRLPALFLPVMRDRQLVALHRVFLDADGRKSRLLSEAKRTLGDAARIASEQYDLLTEVEERGSW